MDVLEAMAPRRTNPAVAEIEASRQRLRQFSRGSIQTSRQRILAGGPDAAVALEEFQRDTLRVVCWSEAILKRAKALGVR